MQNHKPMAQQEVDDWPICNQQRCMPITPSLHTVSTNSSLSLVSHEKEKLSFAVPLFIRIAVEEKGLHVDRLGNVTWKPNSSIHPRNWPISRKCFDTALICFLECLTTLISNTGSSTAGQTYQLFGISKQLALASFTFSYLIGQAIGGLLLPPISETFGGRTIYVVTTALYSVGNLLIGAFPVLPVVVTCRFCCGFFSAMPGTVAAGSLENMWSVRSRIWTIHLWIVSAVLGISLGPSVATFISTSTLGWRWVYMLAGLLAAGAAALCLHMKESRPSRILRQEIQLIQAETGYDGLYSEDYGVSIDIKTFCHTTLLLPIRLFFTEPIVMLTSVMAATVYAIIYVFPEALPTVYSDFGFTARETSLVNLAIAAGIPLTFLPRLLDIRIADRYKQKGQLEEPEHKISGFVIAAPILAIAFWIFGASVPPLQTHMTPWISIACLAGVGFATIEFDCVLSGYLTDSYSSYAASANAPMSFLRAALSGIFPLFAGDMFDKLNTNNAIFVLAAVASFYCLVALWFVRYGKTFREKSPFATRVATAC
ncbi:hypothetical protein AMS68_001822 [Peltaster fructicola]|uniref:Major facilitator superfamily (MFS) profile domain-containing protein n=1 Tax=Peltaster fructicola TaxID=286661 RepID=A0A6H0XNU2_9PEZI|nr:hypothetical protein AMS68_001822 [Peltaster fructicola]